MQSFDTSELTSVKGSLYCMECHAKLSQGAPEARGPSAMEVTGAIKAPPPSSYRGTKVLALVVFLLLIVGLGVGGYLVWHEPKRKPASSPSETGAPPPSSASMDLGTKEPGSLTRPPDQQAAAPIEVPIARGDKSFNCPVCQDKCLVVEGIELPCSRCGRRLAPFPVDLLPNAKYVAKEGTKAVLKLGNKEIRVEKGDEIQPEPRIVVADLEHDGVVVAQTITISFEDHRPGSAGAKTCDVTVRKKIPKFVEGGPIPVEVMQYTKSITCDGKRGDRVYHAEPVTIPVQAEILGEFLVPCTHPDCWNTFKVIVKALPPIQCPIATTADRVTCPQCGCSRFLVPKGKAVEFSCLECDRRIHLYLWIPEDVEFVGAQGNAALIRYQEKEYVAQVGKELWPESKVFLKGFGEEDGHPYIEVTGDVEVKFTDYRGTAPVEKSAKLSLTDRIFKKGG